MDFLDEEIDDMCLRSTNKEGSEDFDDNFPEDDIFDFLDEKVAYGLI